MTPIGLNAAESKKLNTHTQSKLKKCARCGRNHKNLVFKRLTRSQGEWTHWAMCPRNKQPIMLMFYDI